MTELSLANFTALRGSRFMVQLEHGGPLPAELIETRALQAYSLEGRQPFSLLFKGPAAPVLPQSIYKMVRDGDGEPLDIFLVPVSADASGACYEAVFN